MRANLETFLIDLASALILAFCLLFPLYAHLSHV